MASFQNHIDQANDNLSFLIEANKNNPSRWDWQIVVAFYTAVHLVNGHLAKKANLHYRTHEDVKNALSAPLSLCIVPTNIYLAYTKLEGLSRRARYLCHDDPSNRDAAGYFTREKHLAKALSNLDMILDYFGNEYALRFSISELRCGGMERYSALKILKVAGGSKAPIVVPVVESEPKTKHAEAQVQTSETNPSSSTLPPPLS